MLTLHGRVAVVSGGAGAIGAAICLRLLECGAIVYSLDQAGRTPPEGAIQIACNVTDEAAVAAAVLEVDRRSGRLDILVHAAGITRDARLWKARTTPMTASLPGDIRQRAVDESALARLGEPDDVARATVFLVSDLARHVTGQVLRVDGGQLIG